MAMELGAFTPFLWFIKAREMIWDILEEETGARLTHSFGRIGGMAKPPTADFKAMVPRRDRRASSSIVERGREAAPQEPHLPRPPRGRRHHRRRRRARARLDRARACARPASPTTCARRTRTSMYDRVDFDVPVGTTGDNYDRFMVPPRGDPAERAHHRAGARADARRRARSTSTTRASSFPPKDEVYTTIEGTIQHFKLVMEGIKVPAGEVYWYTEGGNGELGFYLVSDGSGTPYRVRIRPPCFAITQALGQLITRPHDRRHRPDLRLAQHDRRRVRSLARASGVTTTCRRFKLDGREIPFEKGDTIIRAAHREGIDIPHYCWHPGLSVAANCRMCLVEIDAAAGPRRR